MKEKVTMALGGLPLFFALGGAILILLGLHPNLLDAALNPALWIPAIVFSTGAGIIIFIAGIVVIVLLANLFGD